MKKSRLAFGVTPSGRRYRLRYARYKALAETVADYARERDGEQALDLLDVGPGTGRTMQYLQAEGCAERFSFHGVDVNTRRLENIFQPESWQLKQADVQDGLPYDDDRFDVVICEQVLEHLRNPDFVVKELSRVLKPKGLLVVGVPIFPRPLASIRHFIRGLGIKWSTHDQEFTLRSINKMVADTEALESLEARGFRIASGGLFYYLENFRWWWRFNLFLGRTLTPFCTEVQINARKLCALASDPPVQDSQG